MLDSIPDLIAAGINSFIDANEAIRPEENVFVDLWPEYGSEDFEVKEPALIVTLRPISEADNFVNIRFPLWDIIKQAVVKEDRIGIVANELRKMADYIDENTKKVKGA